MRTGAYFPGFLEPRKIPGVGPIIAASVRAAVQDPAAFRTGRDLAAWIGITPTANSSGGKERLSLCGDAMMRALLYEAAQVMLTRVKKWSWLKAWAMNVAKRSGHRRAIVALSRRLAVVMHRMWCDNSDFCWTRSNIPAVR